MFKTILSVLFRTPYVLLCSYNIILQVFLSLAVVLERPGLGGLSTVLRNAKVFFVAGDILWEKGEERPMFGPWFSWGYC